MLVVLSYRDLKPAPVFIDLSILVLRKFHEHFNKSICFRIRIRLFHRRFHSISWLSMMKLKKSEIGLRKVNKQGFKDEPG
jgi:hypothetical protein